MPWYSAFTRTSGVTKAFVSTTGQQTFLIAGGTLKAFTVTAGNTPFVVSAGNKIGFTITTPNIVYPVVGGVNTAFTVTPQADPAKLLQLRNGDFSFNTGYTVTTVVDITGVYNAQTNPYGYQPLSAPPDPLRPYRSDLNLWTVYRIKTSDAPNDIIFPTSQAEEAMPDYEYPLSTPTAGIYEILLVGAPNTEDYADYQNQNLQEFAASQTDWFVVGTWITIDANLDQCIANKRYKFLQSVMCGNCDPEYLEFYALYVALYNANAVQSPSAFELYAKLKEKCSADPDCNNCCC